MDSRRNFIRTISGLTLGGASLVTFNPLLAKLVEKAGLDISHLTPKEAADNEDFWYQVQKAYRQSPHFINLESGYFSPQPLEVMEAQFR